MAYTDLFILFELQLSTDLELDLLYEMAYLTVILANIFLITWFTTRLHKQVTIYHS